MRVQTIFLCLVIVFLTGQTLKVKGQTNTGLFEGAIDTTLAIELVKITNCSTYFSTSYFWNECPTLETVPINGEFSFQLPGDSEMRYLKLGFEGKGKNNKALEILSQCIFYSVADDRVDVLIDKDTCIFKGKQQSIFEAQYRIKALHRQYDSEYFSISEEMRNQMKGHFVNQSDVYYQYLGAYKNFNQRILLAIDRLVDNYDDLSSEEKGVLKLNARSEIEMKFIMNLLVQISVGPFSSNEDVRNAILEFYLDQYAFVEHGVEASKYWEKSWSYIEGLYYKSLADLILPLQAKDQQLKVKFEDLYDHITKKNDGLLLDRLLATTLYNFGMSKELPKGYYEKALLTMDDPESSSIVQELADSRNIGTKGYNFRLLDTAGNDVSFEDFKGKVVVVDFWFTGCHGCAGLTTAMKDVYEYFEKDQNVVFVNISIDRNRQKWLESVRLGKYTHSGGVNLYTGETGEKHEIIQHYKIVAYPTMIIFDRQGKVAHFNPRGPFTEIDKNNFINRIMAL